MSSTFVAAARFDWEPVEDFFGQVHAEHEELFALLERSQAELQAWQSDLDEREQRLDAERDELERRQALVEKLTAENHTEADAALQAALAELALLREKLAVLTQERSKLEAAFRELQSQSESLEKQAAARLARVEQSHAEHTAQVESALDAVRQELHASQALLVQGEADLGAWAQTEQALDARVRAADEECCSLREQCALLEVELETVRTHAADWSDQVARLRRELLEQQAQHALELAAFRVQSETTSPPPAPAPSAPPAAAGGPGEAVVGSVLAQFARLNREREGRRSPSKKQPPQS